MVRIAGIAVSADFSVNFRFPCLRVLVLLQNQHSRALAHDETVAALIKRDRRFFGYIFGGKRHAIRKSGNGKRVDGRFRSACDNCIGVTMLYSPERFAHRVGRSSAGGYYREAGALCVETDCNVARRHV